MQVSLSINSYRQKKYSSLIASLRHDTVTLENVIDLGYKLMRKARLNHHFFGNSLWKTARYLAFYALQLPHEYENASYMQKSLSEKDIRQVIQLFEKRITERMPVAYITNEAWYLDRKFYVNENVLVPRSVMSYRFRDFLNVVKWTDHQVLDLCTGSGCIGISLAMMNSAISVDLVDVSEKALNVAAININKYSLSSRVKCLQSDLFSNVSNQYDLIISNPPYVSKSEYKASAAEFKNEPRIALESGKDGLDIVNRILQHAKNHLNPEGILIMEVGYAASKRIKKKYRHIPFKWFTYKKPNASRFDQWFDKLFGLDCVLMCDRRALE
jgi:ribosomal protein L3 glutamine methyltransferase